MSERFSVSDGVAHVDLWYPRSEPREFDAVQICLVDVRAADDIQVRYDFGRDGWSILQASRFQWEKGEKPDPDWQEVAFVKAWAREKP